MSNDTSETELPEYPQAVLDAGVTDTVKVSGHVARIAGAEEVPLWRAITADAIAASVFYLQGYDTSVILRKFENNAALQTAIVAAVRVNMRTSELAELLMSGDEQNSNG